MLAARIRRVGWWTLPALVGLATLGCFSRALDNGFVAWDDNRNFIENFEYRGLSFDHLRWMFTTFHMGHYQPLTWLTFAFDHMVWGMAPRGYHLTNVVFHAANAALVYVLAWEVLAVAGAARESRTWAGVLGALLFAIHPMRVESVAWVTERRDVVSTFFLLLAAITWLRYQQGARAGYGIALGCFALSLLAKAWGMTFPAVLLVLDVWPLRRWGRMSVRRLIVEKLPFVALAVIAAALALLAQLRTGATAVAAPLGPLQRTMQALYGLAFYVRKSILPTDLSPIYVLDRDLDPAAPAYLLSATAVLAGIALLVVARRPAPAAAFAIYAIVVAPVLGFAQSGPQIAADRYSYVACISLAILAGAGLAAASRVLGRAGPLLGLGALAVLGAATWRQTAIWHDSITLWSHAIDVEPRNYLALTNRGWARQERDDLVGAANDYSAAIAINPRYELAYNDRAVVRQLLGDWKGAIADYDQAIRLKPHYSGAYYNRGTAWQAKGAHANAIADYSEAIRLDPGDPRPWNNRGKIRLAAGALDDALADFTAALDADARFYQCYVNRAVVRRKKGDVEGAMADYARALETAPPTWRQREEIARQLATLRAELRSTRD